MAGQQTVYDASQTRGERGVEPVQSGGSPIEQIVQQVIPQVPEPQNPYNAEQYKLELEVRTKKRLLELEAEIRGLSMKRSKEQNAYSQNTQDQMNVTAHTAQEVTPQGEVKAPPPMPASVRAKAGSGEAKRQHKG